MVIVLESVAVGISEPAFLLCGVKGGVCYGPPMYGIQMEPVFWALRICPVFPPVIYGSNLIVLGKKPLLFAVTAFYQDVRVYHPYPVLLFPDEVLFL